MDTEIVDQILVVEEKLRNAMLTSDVEALDELLAPELIFTNHVGQIITKQQDLGVHNSGKLSITEITSSEHKILPILGAAVASVRMKITGSYNGNVANGDFRFTRVWSPSPGGGWHLTAAHSSMIP